MDVGQAHRPSHDAWQSGDVRDLLHARQEAADAPAAAELLQLLEHHVLERLVHLEDALHVHVGHEALFDAPAVAVDLLDVLQLFLVRSGHCLPRRFGEEISKFVWNLEFKVENCQRKVVGNFY